MTGRNDPNKQALLKNRPNIVKNLANPDDVAAHLFANGLFTDEMRDEVLQEPEKEKKNRKILDTLNYRGRNAAKGLYDAFLNTSNEDLAESLAPYIRQLQSEDNKISPDIWPPTFEEQKRMMADPVKRIPEINSPHYIHEYTNPEVYKMRNRIRGKVFIINNETFLKSAELSDRPGSDMDANNLKSLFKQLQFDVVIENNQTAQGMIDFLTKERDKVNWNDMECVVLIIMSHGEPKGVYGTDGNTTKLKDITDLFDSSQCPGLNEKPRLVFVQACRGRNTETGSSGHSIQATDEPDHIDQVVDPMKDMTLIDKGGQDTLDAVPDKVTEVIQKTVHSAADFLIAYATPEETKAYRNTESGSWFLNAIVWTFKYHAYKEDILQLLGRVNELVSKGRTMKGHMTVSEVTWSLRKRFFFFPGVYDNPPKLVDS